jgi:TctA family transporter
VVDWIAYGHAVQTSKDKSQFGKGDIRGVIAPESANNAKQGGALLPTLLFGIPGSGSMAIFLGGMILIGIQPGPSMVDRQPRRHLHDHLVAGARQRARRRCSASCSRPASRADDDPLRR